MNRNDYTRLKGELTTFAYDSHLPCGTPCWIRTETRYDANGTVAQTSRPYFLTGGTPQWTTTSYVANGNPDPYGRPMLVTAPDGSQTHYSYTGLGNSGSQTTVVNALSQSTLTRRNAQGLVSSVVNALGKTTRECQKFCVRAAPVVGLRGQRTDPMGSVR